MLLRALRRPAAMPAMRSRALPRLLSTGTDAPAADAPTPESLLAPSPTLPREVFEAIWASEEDSFIRSTQRGSHKGRAVASLKPSSLSPIEAKGWEMGIDLSGVQESSRRLRVREEDAPAEGDVLARVVGYETAAQAEINRARIEAAVASYKRHGNDTGSTEVQIAVLTQKLMYGEAHLRAHPKDHHSRRGVDAWRTQRRKLLRYLKRKDHAAFVAICGRLSLPVRRSETREDLERQRQRRADELRRKVGTPSRTMKKRLNVVKRKNERARAKMMKHVGAMV